MAVIVMNPSRQPELPAKSLIALNLAVQINALLATVKYTGNEWKEVKSSIFWSICLRVHSAARWWSAAAGRKRVTLLSAEFHPSSVASCRVFHAFCWSVHCKEGKRFILESCTSSCLHVLVFLWKEKRWAEAADSIALQRRWGVNYLSVQRWIWPSWVRVFVEGIDMFPVSLL